MTEQVHQHEKLLELCSLVISNKFYIIFIDLAHTDATLNLIPKLFRPINVGMWTTFAIDIQSGFLLHVTL